VSTITRVTDTAASEGTAGRPAPAGRRARKRMETRQSLVNAAIALFDERGFDQVTVTDIADRADVDASTFFRHFGSKEAVLFTDWVDFTDNIGAALDRRPPEEQLFDAIVGALLEMGSRRPIDGEMEFLRGKLTQSSPVLKVQSLVYRERLVNELAAAIARRLGTDPATDAYPYLAATVWAAALDFYRRRAVTTSPEARRPDKPFVDLLGDVLDILRPVWQETAPERRQR
jgi:AcrR family transcriptional regulator